MRITHQTTTLRTLEEGDIELVRSWRNDGSVNQYLINKKPISKAEQTSWFKSLNPESSIHFMMEESSIPFGVIYVHDIPADHKSFWGSIITGNSKFMNTHLPVKSVMMLFVFFFEHLHFDRIFSKVHINNQAARQMNKHFGFTEISNSGEYVTCQCLTADFAIKSRKMRTLLLRNIPLTISLEKEDKKYPFLSGITEKAR